MKRLLLNAVLLLSMMTTQAQTSDLARGADISWCTEMEADGRKFYNAEGTETDIFALMKELGMTAIRLRVWVNPQGYGYGAWCDKADVLAKAKRAKDAGLDLMIDFHYSDFFCDPGTQTTPLDWANYSKDQLKTAMAEHTGEVLQALKDQGIEPKWVQVGNETNNGLLWPLGKIDWSKSGSVRYTAYVELSNVGYDAVKTVFPNAYVIVHIGGTVDATWFFTQFKTAGGKFDMMGLSHYPTEAEWDSTSSEAKYSNVRTASIVSTIAKSNDVPVMICETGFNVYKPALASTVMTDLFTRMKAIPQCAGIFYWEPQVDGNWKPAYYNTIGWGAYSLGAFTTNGRPTAALNAFCGRTGEETGQYPSQLSVYNKDGNTVLATLPSVSDGVYTGQLNATTAWLNFWIVDETNNVWYGCDPSDKSKVSAADNHWNFWIDSEQTGVYDLTVDLVNMKWTHTLTDSGIEDINSHRWTDNNCYDLLGRRINSQLNPDIYILRGRKIIK